MTSGSRLKLTSLAHTIEVCLDVVDTGQNRPIFQKERLRFGPTTSENRCIHPDDWTTTRYRVSQPARPGYSRIA